jgi:hypothetical protein
MTVVTQLRQVADIQTLYIQNVNLSVTDILGT